MYNQRDIILTPFPVKGYGDLNMHYSEDFGFRSQEFDPLPNHSISGTCFGKLHNQLFFVGD